MLIGFWSPLGEKCAVTSNMVFVTAMMALTGKKKYVMLENHYNMRSIGSVVMSGEQNRRLREKHRYNYRYGIEHIFREIQQNNLKIDDLFRSTIPVIDDKLLYIPQSFVMNKQVFSLLMEENLFKLVDYLEEICDEVVIDIASRGWSTTNELIERCDLLVVNLPQSTKDLNSFFENYFFLKQKSIYIISKYRDKISQQYRNICLKYQLKRDNCAYIPYNIYAQEAIEKGQAVQFIYSAQFSKDNDYRIEENVSFGNEVFKASDMIKANVSRIYREMRQEGGPENGMGVWSPNTKTASI